MTLLLFWTGWWLTLTWLMTWFDWYDGRKPDVLLPILMTPLCASQPAEWRLFWLVLMKPVCGIVMIYLFIVIFRTINSDSDIDWRYCVCYYDCWTFIWYPGIVLYSLFNWRWRYSWYWYQKSAGILPLLIIDVFLKDQWPPGDIIVLWTYWYYLVLTCYWYWWLLLVVCIVTYILFQLCEWFDVIVITVNITILLLSKKWPDDLWLLWYGVEMTIIILLTYYSDDMTVYSVLCQYSVLFYWYCNDMCGQSKLLTDILFVVVLSIPLLSQLFIIDINVLMVAIDYSEVFIEENYYSNDSSIGNDSIVVILLFSWYSYC